MLTFILKRIGLIGLLSALFTLSYAQNDIFSIQERRDLNIRDVEILAKKYFDSVGTERGTGYKQYQRWLYEVKFHLDENGFQLHPEHDWTAYKNFNAGFSSSVNGSNESVPANNGPWQEKGPFNWNRTSGWNPGVGRLTSIAIHPLDTNLIYVASPGGGIWKSSNAGQLWAPITDFNGLWMNMYAVAVDPTNKNIVFAGSNANVVIKSTDAGASWVPINSGMTGVIRKIMVHPSNPNLVLVAAGNGIWRSTNGGGNWTRTFVGTMEDIECKPGSANVIYASGTSSVLRSLDAGQTWTTIGAAEGIATSGRTLIGVSAANPEKVYVAQANGNEFGFLFVSNNGGSTFSTAVAGSSSTCTNFFGYETTGCGNGGQAGYDMALVVNPENENEIYLAGIIVFKSTDGGLTFTPSTAWSYPNSIGYNHADVHDLQWMNKTLYSGSDGGIFKSIDKGDNWIDISEGLGIRQFYRIANSKTNSQLFTGGAQDNGSSVFRNGNWQDWLGADGMDGLIHPANENLMIGTSQNGSIYRSVNGGISYTSLTKPGNGEWVTPLDFDEKNNAMYGGWNGVYKSVNNGDSWSRISGNAILTTLTCLKIAPSDSNYIYASKGTTFYISKNAGKNWTTVTLPAAINDIEVSATNPEKVWVACNSTFNRVFVSVNAGTSFTNISDNLPSIIARTIVVGDDADETIYVGLNIGIFYRNNTTAGWVDITNNLPMVAINDLKIHKQGQILRVASYGRGVWERSLIGAAVQACGTPSNLSVTAVSSTSATVSWDAIVGASNYVVEYQQNGAADWTVAASAITASSVNFSGLNAGTLYNWRVAAVCAGAKGTYAVGQFQSLIACATPVGLTTTNITETSATIGWSTTGSAISYEVAFKAFSETQWNNLSMNTSATSWNLSGLNTGTLYDVRVKANCEVDKSNYLLSQFSTAAVAVCVDAFEPNNTSRQAKSIIINEEVRGGISTSTDEDWFKFSTGNNSFTHVKINLTQLPDDYDVYLYDKNFRMVGASANTGTNNDILIFNSTAKRMTYYAKVVGKQNNFNTRSCYSLKAELNSTAWAPQLGAVIAMDDNITGTTVYPNPASSFFNLRFESKFEEKGTWILINSTGAAVSKNNLQVYKGQNQHQVSVADLAPGMYILQLRSANLQINKQVVVVH